MGAPAARAETVAKAKQGAGPITQERQLSARRPAEAAPAGREAPAAPGAARAEWR